jgi:putative transposase
MQFRRTFKYRLYPSKTQQTTINTQLKLCRQLYNELLGVKIETFEQSKKSLSRSDLNECIIYFNAQIPELKQIYSQVKQDISDRITKSFRNMFSRIKRGEVNVGFPRFKGRGSYKSLCYPQSGYTLTPKNKLHVAKIGEMNIKLHRPIEGTIKTMTINKTSTNKYYVTFSCIVEKEPAHKSEIKTIGLDVGLNHFVTLSNGEHIGNPRYLKKSETKLAQTQRKHSRKKLYSKNRNKSRLKIAKIYEKVRNQRLDFTHKLSTQITQNYSIIGIECLNISGMLHNHHLSKAISDVAWRMFYNQLDYKAEQAGSIIQESEQFFPSSKTCNKCGSVQDMPLYIRIFECTCCGNIDDRDTNAAKNLDQNALRILKINTAGIAGINACEDVPLGTSMKQEATS